MRSKLVHGVTITGYTYFNKLVHGVTNGKVLAALSATSCEDAATVLSGHTSAETMLVQTAMVVWLESHLHSCIVL